MFLFAFHVGSGVSLNISEPRTCRVFHPNIVVRRQLRELAGNDSVLNRDRPDFAMANISEREIVGSIATILADIGLTADYSVDNSVIGKEFRRVVGDRFNRRLPREEVALQEIFCRIGKVSIPARRTEKV